MHIDMVDWTKRAWCSPCNRYRLTEDLIVTPKGQKRCPQCNMPVRTKPRNAGDKEARFKNRIKMEETVKRVG